MVDKANPIGLTLSALAKVLEPTVRHANRVYRERQAARGTSLVKPDLLEQSFEETLGRLIKSKVEESWWRSLLNAFEQQFVAPDFLKPQRYKTGFHIEVPKKISRQKRVNKSSVLKPVERRQPAG